jgi:preprotein translocase subunit SecY
VITLVGGTMFLMWLGEQITARGIGNGISLIIFAGIVAELPRDCRHLELGRTGALSTGLIIGDHRPRDGTIAVIVFVERAQRRLLIQYPKRQVGNRMFQGDTSHLPLKLNTAGVIPPIFASSLLLLPATYRGLLRIPRAAGLGDTVNARLATASRCTWRSTPVMIIFFAFFYTAIVFNPKDTADNLKKHGGFIPGIRPGERTAEYIDYVLTRITVVGASISCSSVCYPNF